MKLEITHDTLALKIFERSSGEDKMRLKVRAFIRSRHAFYRDEGGGLLRAEDLSYIKPHVNNIILTKEEEAYVRRSFQVSQWRNIGVLIFVIIAFLTLGRFYVISQEKNIDLLHKESIYQETLRDLRTTNKKREEAQKKFMQSDSLYKATKEELQELTMRIRQINDSLEIENNQLLSAELRLSSQLKRKDIELNTLKKELDQAKKRPGATNKPKAPNTTPSVGSSLDISAPSVQLSARDSEAVRRANANILAARAQSLLGANRPDIKMAFQYADRALELDPNNEHARLVVRRIHFDQVGIQQDYFRKNAPLRPLTNKAIGNARSLLRRQHGTLSDKLEAECLKN